MRDARVEKLFLRYRDRGSVKALGKVFDATADELYQVALNLTREPSDADDLVQETFLTVLDRASAWDPSRRLVPWMIGILVNHAHAQRRRAARTPEPDRLERGEVETPLQAATRVEASAQLLSAIQRLPRQSREVLEIFVRDGKRAVEIATELGRAPGTVRMQMHRGLEQLRRVLPAGAALGLLISTAGTGRAGVRDAVLDHALRLRPEAVAAAPLGKSKLLGRSGLLAVPLVAGSWLAFEVLRGEPVRDPSTDLASAEMDEFLAEEGPRPAHAGDSLRAGEQEARAPGLDRPDRSRRSKTLALLTPDGTPAGGVPFEALDLRSDRAAAAESVAGVTDPEGGLGLELDPLGVWALRFASTPPATMLVPDMATGTGSLGTLQLPSRPPELLQLLGPAGSPLPGVEVTALPSGTSQQLVTTLAGLGFEVLDATPASGSVLHAGEALSQLTAAMPLVSVATDAKGWAGFSLPADAVVAFLVRLPGGGVQLAEHDAITGQLHLPATRAIDGVLHIEGGGLARGWEVRASASSEEAGPLLPLLCEATSDAEGHFRLAGLPADASTAFIATRPSPDQPWTSQRISLAQDLQLTVPANRDLDLRLWASGTGEAIEGTVTLAPSRAGLDASTPLALESPGARRRSDHSSSQHSFSDLRPVPRTALVRAPGRASLLLEVDPRAPSGTVMATLEEALPRTLVLQEGGTPLVGAQVRVLWEGVPSLPAAEGVTDHQGTVVLDGLARSLEASLVLEVLHPTRRPWVSRARSVLRRERAEVELSGGSVEVVCRDRAIPPLGPLRLVLHRDGAPRTRALEEVLLGESGADGLARHTNLQPGRWIAETPGLAPWARPRDLLLLTGLEIGARDSAPWTSRASRPASTVLDVQRFALGLEAPAGDAGLSVRVQVGGAPASGGDLSLRFVEQSGYRTVEATLDAQGEAHLVGLRAGTWSLRLHPTSEGPASVLEREFLLTDGRTEVLSLDLDGLVRVVATQPSGRPASAGWLHVQDEAGLVWSHALSRDGSVEFWRPARPAGAFVQHFTGARTVILPEQGTERLRLEAGLEVALRVDLDLANLPPELRGYGQVPGLWIFAVTAIKVGEPHKRVLNGFMVREESPIGEVTLTGLEPGRWEIEVHPAGEPHRAAQFLSQFIEVDETTTSVGDLTIQRRQGLQSR